MKKLFSLVVVLLALSFMSCDNDKKDHEIQVESINIEKLVSIDIDETHQLKVTITPEEATVSKDVEWISSNTKVATVDESGLVKAISTGEAVITVTLKEAKTIKAACKVIVMTSPDTEVEFEDSAVAAFMMQFDKNNDGIIQVSEAREVKELRINAKRVKSLKGIEYCTSLEILDAGRNELTEIDLTKNVALKEVYLYNNTIKEINVTTLPALQVLNIRANHLAKIDVIQNLELRELMLGMNNFYSGNGDGLTEVDVTKNTKLEKLETYFTNVNKLDVTQNPKLKWLNIGLSAYVSTTHKPMTEIDLSKNTELEFLDCEGRNEDGEGLQALDLTNNPKLKHVFAIGHNIKAIDLSKNVDLTYLILSRNPLTELNLTSNPLIDTLGCEWTSIVKLDLTKSKELKYLNCANSKIDALDFSNTKIGYVLANDNAIKTINMGDKAFDTPGGQPVGPYLYMKLNNNLIESIDLSKQTYLRWLEINDNKLTGTLDVNGCTELRGLLCKNNQLTEVKSDQLKELWTLETEGNPLKK